MARNTVEIDEDVFIDMCMERVDELGRVAEFEGNFWADCMEYLSEIGFMGDPRYNTPSYIIDNIVYNGEICHSDDCADNYDEINEDYDGDVIAWAEDNNYLLFGDYVVINLGL
jgi:hypothetical protein